MYMTGSGAGESRFRRAPPAEKDIQQAGVEHDRKRHRAVRQNTMRQVQIYEHPGKTETYDPDVETHAHAAKRLRVESPDQVGAQRYAYEYARNDRGNESEAVDREKTEVVIRDSSQGRFGDPDESEACRKFLLYQPL